MKNFIRTVPKEWLEEKECRECKETIFLENKYYISSAEKNNRAPRQYEFFGIIAEKPSDQNQPARKNKETHRNHPENRRNDFERHKCIENSQNWNHTCEKYWIPVICIVDPEP